MLRNLAPPPNVPGYALLETPPEAGHWTQDYDCVRLADGKPFKARFFPGSDVSGDLIGRSVALYGRTLIDVRHAHLASTVAVEATDSGAAYAICGSSKRDLVKWKEERGSFEWDDFWQAIGRPITDALVHGHDRYHYHGALTPRCVVFNDDGKPALTGFGLAKLARLSGASDTQKNSKDGLFLAPAAQDGDSDISRDLYSLAAVFAWCASPSEFANKCDMREFVRSFSGFQPGVRDLLLEALSDDPDDRPAVADQFLSRAEAATIAARPTRHALSCLLSIHHARVRRIGHEFDLAGQIAIEKAIVADLNAVCAIEPKPESSGEIGDPYADLWLYGLTRSYHVRPEGSPAKRFAILSARTRATGWLEAKRDGSLTPKVDFSFVSRGPDRDARSLSQIQQLVDQYVRERNAAEDEVESWQIEIWSRILQAKQELELGKERPIRYDKFSLDDRRVRFRTVGGIPQDAAMEERQIRLNDGSFLTGHIEEFVDDFAIFLVSGGDVDLLRPNGEISVNVFAASEALNRQRLALEGFRQRDIARPDLADVLLDPETAQAIKSIDVDHWFQAQLDEDKREAVAAALGSADILLTKGPPGTGKTTFIAELIMQELDRNPNARILLASQTHVAIDNAIERLVELRSQSEKHFEVVRVGTNDERISASVEQQRIHNRLQSWTETVAARVTSYAEERASNAGVARDDVLKGFALKQLIMSKEQLSYCEERLADLDRQKPSLPTRDVPSNSHVLDLDVANTENSRQLEISQLREERKALAAEVERLKAELTLLGDPAVAQLPLAELSLAADICLSKGHDDPHLQPLIELGADWITRFGRQDHFEAPFLSTVQVLAGTCLGVVSSKTSNDLKFDLCIVDEASKATPTELFVPLSRAKRWVLVGDTKQLPPFQDEAMRNKDFLERHDLRHEDVAESLFTHLERLLPNDNVLTLKSQRRMVQPINDLIQACFYPEHELICRRDGPTFRFNPRLPNAITWIDTSRSPRREEDRPGEKPGFYNKLECELIHAMLRKIDGQFVRRRKISEDVRVSVAVITGYQEQVSRLERALRPKSDKWKHLDISINSVDAFQGRQADLLIFSVVRSNPWKSLGFLDQMARLNVALSRGKDALVIVGDREFCMNIQGENPFREVIRFIGESDGCGVELVE